MKLRGYNYRDVLKQIIEEEVLKYSNLLEIFDSSPFQSHFRFLKYEYGVKSETFKDNQGNTIQVIFHKMNNENYEVDFTVNGSSYENLNIVYSVKDYSSLIQTVFKCIEQFIEEYDPEGLGIEGEDSLTKIDVGKKGQKNSIYKYALKNINIPPNYVLLTNENGGVQILKK